MNENNVENQPQEENKADQSDSKQQDKELAIIPEKNKYGTTQSVAESLARVRKELGASEDQQRASITLNVLGFDEPLTFHDKHQITLGRMNPTTDERPDVDLSGLSLDTSGVSRLHLKFIYLDQSWHVEDTGSRNGTWLNGKLLMAYQRYKLRDGDQLRAGNIIIIVITYAVTASEAKSNTPLLSLPDSLHLAMPAVIDNQQGLSPVYIAKHLMPYLSSIIEIMQLIDRAKKRSQREISIVSVEFRYPIIVVQLSCAHEALQFMQSNLSSLHPSNDLSALTGATEAISPVNPLTEPVGSRDAQSSEIARRFAEQYFPLIAPDQSLYYQRLLIPLLGKCIESDLKIVT